jgi:hypothetical protein
MTRARFGDDVALLFEKTKGDVSSISLVPSHNFDFLWTPYSTEYGIPRGIILAYLARYCIPESAKTLEHINCIPIVFRQPLLESNRSAHVTIDIERVIIRALIFIAGPLMDTAELLDQVEGIYAAALVTLTEVAANFLQ